MLFSLYLLYSRAVNRVSLAVLQHIHVPSANQFLYRVGGIRINLRRTGCLIGFIYSLQLDAVIQITCKHFPLLKHKPFYIRCMRNLPRLRFHIQQRFILLEVRELHHFLLELQIRCYTDNVLEVAPNGFGSVEINIIHRHVQDTGLLIDILDSILIDGLRRDGIVMNRLEAGAVIECIGIDRGNGSRDEHFFLRRTTFQHFGCYRRNAFREGEGFQ